VMRADSMRPSISALCSLAADAASSSALRRASSAARAFAASPRLRLEASAAALSACCLASCERAQGGGSEAQVRRGSGTACRQRSGRAEWQEQ
jgi:hypothetical protein